MRHKCTNTSYISCDPTQCIDGFITEGHMPMHSRFSNTTETSCQCGCGDPAPVPPEYGFTIEWLNNLDFKTVSPIKRKAIMKVLLEDSK